ncbi:putative major pilin subunit [Anaerohalosphaera lusitana]|uniref:Putative major pilin subunit n=1 Tax=Anaerohalosphaera lusitana TaxID=1936003 RepID=A0A1U9NKL0_9BACT|nr:type II secretion system protein [Anaerohalosphaera lusitana]AQT68473.1 putative major pilin subunit [Anaerohalosphaera lusitana]
MARKKGFTLIELLVVISIIALLMAIMMPALSMVKERAKRVICGSNTKQVGIGLFTYAQSYDDKLPPQYGNEPWEAVLAYYPDGSHNPVRTQLAILYEEKIVGNPEVFYCPSQPRHSDYPIPYYYDFYTDNGTVEWGSEFIPIPGLDGHELIRTSYNYWLHGQKKTSALSRNAILVDNCQEWEVVPHRKGSSGDPQGLYALFGDGHANFATRREIFDDDLWPKDFRTVFNGPGNDTEKFELILKEIEKDQ